MNKGTNEFCICFVDTENCSPQIIDRLITLIKYELKNCGCAGIWCYALSDGKSLSSEEWKKQSETLKSFEWKTINTERSKNAVDKAIISDIRKLVDNPKNNRITTWIIATGDKDYIDIVKHLKEKGKKVFIITHNYGNVSDKLKAMATKWILG